MNRSYSKIAFLVMFNNKLLFSLIILLIACPLWGQVNNKFLTNWAPSVENNFIKVCLKENKVFFELDDILLNKSMLFVRHDKGYMQVVWSRHMDYILLETPRIESLSGAVIPINNDPSIQKNTIGAFPIIKEKSNSQIYYIDVTDLFLQNSVEWYSGFSETVITNLSLINDIRYLKDEIVISTNRVVLKNTAKSTTKVDFSFFLMPEPMKPRLFDYRIGYFIEDENSYINHFAKNAKATISRWRLEKRFKDKKISEPIKPITFYLDPNVPNKWKPYIKAGIFEWLSAFEAAGFKNAIQIKDAPIGDNNWYINSVNSAIVRWSNKDEIRLFEKNFGSTVLKITDFRSGEILKSDIIIGSLIQNIADEYFVRCSPLDKRAHQYPFPDDLMGELIQSLVAHEAGHAFGLKDANYGEYTYPFSKMRDIKWLEEMGHTPSIMTYAKHNYIVQPEDNISPSLLIQKVGPTDVYNIKWGYQTIPNISRPQDELPYLEKLIRQQDTVPWYRYNISQFETIGPGCSNEVVDNDNPIKSTEFGLKNMKRVMELLPTISKSEKDSDLLERLYHKSLTLWFNQMKHVLTLIGGYTIHYKSGNQNGAVYTQIPQDTQEDALDFLLLNAFEVPNWLVNPEFASRFQYSMATDRMTGYQLELLSEVLSAARIKRVEKMEFSSKDEEITKKLLSKLQVGLWVELFEKTIKIKYNRQELQNAYIAFLTEAITSKKNYVTINASDKYYVYSDYSRSIFMSELINLKETITNNLNKANDSSTQAHLKLCLLNLDKIVLN